MTSNFLDNVSTKIQYVAFQTSKMDQIALEYWYNSFLGRPRVDGRGFFYQKPILKKRSPDQKSRCRTCAEACHSPFKPCTASLCGKVSPCLWWSRLGFYLEDFVFHSFGQETHWSLLESCPVVLYNAHRLVSFGLNVPLDCLCGHSDETPEHLFFYFPWLRVVWIGSSPYSSSPLLWHQLLLYVMFSSVWEPVLFGFWTSVCSSCLLLPSVSAYVFSQRNDYRFPSECRGAHC